MDGQEDQDFSKLPLDERLAHKNWKARVSAYEDLAKLFPTYEDKEFSKYSPLVKKFVLDTNAAAQEKGLSAVLAYVDYCPVAGKYVEGIIAGLATKCLNSTRAKTKEIANDIVLMCIEIERQDGVLEELIKALDQKTPKNVAAVVRMITKALNQFGSKVIAIKPIVPVLAKMLEDRDPNVREETKQLSIEIYRWVKDALLPQLSNLKPILLDSLKEEFEKVKDSKAKPERLLRSQQQRVQDEADGGAVPGAECGEGAGDDAPEEEIDPFELMEPVDILSKLPSDFYTLIEAKKWQERKESLEKLLQLLEANPKLIPNLDYAELVKQLKRIIGKDTNIVVATLAIKCLTLLATGLRKGFDKHAHGCVTVVLEKFKEKKANVVQELRKAIDAIYISTNLEAIQEDLTAALDNKNPGIRSETALFMARAFANTNPNLVNKKLLKTYVTSLLKTLGDSDPTVRESSAEVLGTAAKAQGDRNMGPLLQGLEQLKMAKIDEYKSKVEVKKFSAAPIPAPAPAAPAIRPKPGIGGPARKTTGARVVKPPPVNSSQESLDMPEAPLPKRSAPSKFSTIKSRLDTGTKSAHSDSGSSTAPKYGTVKRPGTVSTSRLVKPTSSAGSSKKTEDLSSSSPMMQHNKMKEQRTADERALKVLKWNFTAPREEFYHQLKEQMEAASWNPALITNAFHNDFKFHIKAIEQMRDFFSKNRDTAPECIVANIDLILKWIALRFFDTNPSVIMKALELLLLIFGILEATNYSMTDMEANSFFPYLVSKCGDPKDVVRNKVHEILVILRSLTSATRIFAGLFAGLKTKNSRQKSTCLEEIAQLIELKGMAIFGPPNSVALIKDIAGFLSERDNGIRNGALSCIVQVYLYEGENVYKRVGNLNDKELSLIEERIKRASKLHPQRSDKRTNSVPSLLELNNNGGGSGQSTFASGLPGANRFGATLTRPAASAQYHTPEMHQEAPPTRAGTITKIGGIPSMAAPGTPNTGTFLKGRSHSGLGLGQKAGSSLSFSRTPLQVKLEFEPTNTVPTPIYNGSNGDRSSSEFSPPRKSIDTDMESFSVVTTSTEESDELDRRVQEILTLPEVDPEMIRRIRDKIEGRSPQSTGSGGSPRSAMAYNGSSPSTNGSGGSPYALNAELTRKMNDLFTDLSSVDDKTLLNAFEHLNNLMKNYNGARYGPYLEPRIEQLVVLCNKQFRLFLTKRYPASMENPTARQNAVTIFRGVALLVMRIFQCPLGKKVSRDTLRELITHLLPYFLDEMKKEENKIIFESVNVLIHEMIKCADTTNLSTALIRMLYDYVGSMDITPRDSTAQMTTFLELTMKFIWRLVKFFDRHYEGLNVDVLLLEIHLFFKSYPRTWWKKNERDDMPLRTIKTLVYLIVRKKGESILSNFTLIENKDESELSLYVQKSLRQCDQARDSGSSTAGSASDGKLNGSTASSTMGPTPTRSMRSLNGDENDIPMQQQNGISKLPHANSELPRYIPRVQRADFPLPTRQLNNLTNLVSGNQGTAPPTSGLPTIVPVIRNSADVRTYCDYTATDLNVSIDYEAIREAARANPIRSTAQAEEAVAKARERLANLKSLTAQNAADREQSRFIERH